MKVSTSYVHVCVCAIFFRCNIIFSFVIYIARPCVSHFFFVCSVLTFTISMNELKILGAALATSTTSPSTSSFQTSDPLSSSSSVPSVSPHRQGSGTGTGTGNSLSQQTNTQSSIGNKNPLHVLVKYCEYVTYIAVVIVYNLWIYILLFSSDINFHLISWLLSFLLFKALKTFFNFLI